MTGLKEIAEGAKFLITNMGLNMNLPHHQQTISTLCEISERVWKYQEDKAAMAKEQGNAERHAIKLAQAAAPKNTIIKAGNIEVQAKKTTTGEKK
jgi:hypothetical protein